MTTPALVAAGSTFVGILFSQNQRLFNVKVLAALSFSNLGWAIFKLLQSLMNLLWEEKTSSEMNHVLFFFQVGSTLWHLNLIICVCATLRQSTWFSRNGHGFRLYLWCSVFTWGMCLVYSLVVPKVLKVAALLPLVVLGGVFLFFSILLLFLTIRVLKLRPMFVGDVHRTRAAILTLMTILIYYIPMFPIGLQTIIQLPERKFGAYLYLLTAVTPSFFPIFNFLLWRDFLFRRTLQVNDEHASFSTSVLPSSLSSFDYDYYSSDEDDVVSFR
jgi:hypothetical protein